MEGNLDQYTETVIGESLMNEVVKLKTIIDTMNAVGDLAPHYLNGSFDALRELSLFQQKRISGHLASMKLASYRRYLRRVISGKPESFTEWVQNWPHNEAP